MYYHIFTWNKYFIHRTIGLNIWWRNLCWQAQKSDVCCSFSAGLHRSWEGFWSIPLLVIPLQILKVPRPFSCCKTHPRPIFNALTEGRRLSPKISWHMAPFILPSIRWSCPVPLAEKHPQSIRFPPSCFTVGMVFWGLYSAFLFLQTRQVELMPNSSILVSSDHITFSGSSRCSLANFRRACTCAFFSRGTLRAQQDFNPSQCSVLLMVLYCDCDPNCLQVINKLLLCSTGLIPDLSHHHWYPTRGDLVWRPRPREIGGDFVFLPFSNNCSNSC